MPEEGVMNTRCNQRRGGKNFTFVGLEMADKRASTRNLRSARREICKLQFENCDFGRPMRKRVWHRSS